MDKRFRHTVFLTGMAFLCGMFTADGEILWAALFGALAVYDSRQIQKAP